MKKKKNINQKVRSVFSTAIMTGSGAHKSKKDYKRIKGKFLINKYCKGDDKS